MFEVFFFVMKKLQNRKQLKANTKTFLYLSNGDKTPFPLQYIWLNQDKNKRNNN